MAESVTFQSATLATIPDGSKVAADIIVGEIYQRVKTTFGVDGTATDVSAGNPLPVTGTTTVTGTVATSELPAGTGASNNVASSATNVTILAANVARLGGTVANDSTAILYLKLGASSSATSYTVQMAGSTSLGISYYELPYKYSGIVTGTWASATGNARVTELTA